MARYVVYGAGAIGGVIGGLLHAGGREVVLVARGAHGGALAAGGLRLEGPGGTRVLPIPTVEHPEQAVIGPEDVVVLAMKSQDSEEALRALAACAPSQTAVVCAQNGVENERVALRRFPNVYACLVLLPASHLEPGVVTHSAGPLAGVLDLGRFPSGTDAVAEQVSADLASAGFLSAPRPDAMAWKHRKLLSNLGNAVDALFPRNELAAEVTRQARAEGAAVLAAAGREVVPEERFSERSAAFRQQPPAKGLRSGSSSWQSLARGTGSIEADYLNGEIVLLGRLHGVATPCNERLQRLATEHARRGLPPGGLGEHELGSLLAG